MCIYGADQQLLCFPQIGIYKGKMAATSEFVCAPSFSDKLPNVLCMRPLNRRDPKDLVQVYPVDVAESCFHGNDH